MGQCVPRSTIPLPNHYDWLLLCNKQTMCSVDWAHFVFSLYVFTWLHDIKGLHLDAQKACKHGHHSIRLISWALSLKISFGFLPGVSRLQNIKAEATRLEMVCIKRFFFILSCHCPFRCNLAVLLNNKES